MAFVIIQAVPRHEPVLNLGALTQRAPPHSVHRITYGVGELAECDPGVLRSSDTNVYTESLKIHVMRVSVEGIARKDALANTAAKVRVVSMSPPKREGATPAQR